MPAFEEAESLRLLRTLVDKRVQTILKDQGVPGGEAAREGRNVPQGKGYMAITGGFATGYDATTGETTTPFITDLSILGGEDILTGS